jgi:hypothetical protein
MNRVLLADGDPVQVDVDGDRIGAGPWARWLASAVVPDESSARAERGRELAWCGAVRAVTVAAGALEARVVGTKGHEYDVAILADPLPPSAWEAAVRAAAARPHLDRGLEGVEQSVHLAHLLDTDLRAPLVPPTRVLRTSCTCPDRERSPVCKHVAALAFIVADAIDDDPSLLLRWRGCEPVAPPAARSGDPWAAGSLPPPPPPRALPPGAVVKRLGRSGIRVGGHDLSEALAPAYRAFADTARADARAVS